MKKPDFRDFYHQPDSHLDFITLPSDTDFEGQNFDRKQVGQSNHKRVCSKANLASAKEHVEKTISGLANATGGVLVLGVSGSGDVLGINHLTEEQQTSLLNVDSLRGAAIQKKIHDVSVGSENRQIALFMVEASERTFCCRVRDDVAWIRRGPSTVRLVGDELEQVKRDRKVVDFERQSVCEFVGDDVDGHVAEEFISSNQIRNDRSHVEVLYDAGATVGRSTKREWTNAGLLFFAFNPQRVLGHAYIRVLRFDCTFQDEDERPTPDFDRNFDGSLTQQIRDLRTFFRESGFFKTFERRALDGGFVTEPEYPAVAIDEAIVNAVAHRDYGINRPIFCEKYTDALVVRSPGSLRQPEQMPDKFKLDEVQLESVPRNAKLMEWLRSMKDATGASYVKALREGTRKMRDEMAGLGLPAPTYRLDSIETEVVLENNLKDRASPATGLAGVHGIDSHEFTNLYQLKGIGETGAREGEKEDRRILLKVMCDKLQAQGWVIDELGKGRAVVHVKGTFQRIPKELQGVLRIIPAYVLGIRSYFRRQYLFVDFTARVQSIWTVDQAAAKFGANTLVGLRAYASAEGNLVRGRIADVGPRHVVLQIQEGEDDYECSATSVFPILRRDHLEQVTREIAPDFDLAKSIKAAALSTVKGAARHRAERIASAVRAISMDIFPISLGTRTIDLELKPLRLAQDGDGRRALRVEQVGEPEVEFGRKRSSANIREGITSFGSYKDDPKDLEIIAVVEPGFEYEMRNLVQRLQLGSYRFRGSEWTFATKLRLSLVSTAQGISIDEECQRLVREYPEWRGDADLNRLMLVHTPEAGFAIDDVQSPYYVAKRVLLESGIPCQMVDTPTLLNPDYKDLNLALNIVAKTGVTPWVLPESIPDADFFVGLSYTSSRWSRDDRVVGFANVFNQYGRWEFYSGGNEAVPFRERAGHYEHLVRSTLSRLDLREHPTVYFHYSAKFSHIEREAIRRGARAVRPHGRYVFIWINGHHPVRLFDERAESDGSLARGRYMIGARNQIYLSTTGYNPYRKAIGTPQALEINVYEDEEVTKERPPPDHKSMAKQILSLTKLNWASTDALCGEPITIKYAKNIAYLTAAFQRQERTGFRLHNALERTPWFI